MHDYRTMVEAINGLKERGFTYDFNLETDHLACDGCGPLSPDDFSIVEMYRFEGPSNPSDSSIVYGIESTDGRQKGVLVNAYGVYGEELSAAMVAKLNEKRPTSH